MPMPWTWHGWFALARGFCPALASPMPMLAERRARGSAWPRVLQCTEEGTCSLAGDLHCSLLSVCRNRGCQQWKENMLGRSLPGEDRQGERQAASPQAAVGKKHPSQSLSLPWASAALVWQTWWHQRTMRADISRCSLSLSRARTHELGTSTLGVHPGLASVASPRSMPCCSASVPSASCLAACVCGGSYTPIFSHLPPCSAPQLHRARPGLTGTKMPLPSCQPGRGVT